MKTLIETRQVLHVGIELEEAKALTGDWEILKNLIHKVVTGDGSNATDYAALEAKALAMDKYFEDISELIPKTADTKSA